MATLAALQKQIAKLTAEAERLRKTEAKAVIAKIRESIAEFALTPADLFGAEPKGRRAGPSAVAGKAAQKPVGRRSAGAPKYRDPITGATWTGVGRVPNWMVAAKDRTAFLIGEQEGARETTPRRVAKQASAAPGAGAPGKKAAAKKAAATQPAAKKARGNAAGAKKAKGTEAKAARKAVAKKTANGAAAADQRETAAVSG